MADQDNSADFRRVLARYPTGVCVVTAIDREGAPAGLSVGSFTSVSLDPPLVGFFPDQRSESWRRIAEAGRFCVNVLSDDQQHLCAQFSSRGADKFAGVDYVLSLGGAPILAGVVAWIDCTIASVSEAGDHYCVLGLVTALDVGPSDDPLLFLRGAYGGFVRNLPDRS